MKGHCERVEKALFIVRRKVTVGGTYYAIDQDSEHLFDAVMVGTDRAIVKGTIEMLGIEKVPEKK